MVAFCGLKAHHLPCASWLRLLVGSQEALAEHVARHPEDAGRTVEDFNWIVRTIVRPAA
jgi:hypothetical protein